MVDIRCNSAAAHIYVMSWMLMSVQYMIYHYLLVQIQVEITLQIGIEWCCS